MRRVCFLLMVGMFAAILATTAFAVDTVPPTPVPTVIEGTATAVTISTTGVGGSITVAVPPVTPTGPTRLVTFAVTDKTQIFKNGNPAKLGDVKVGDAIRALVNQSAAGAALVAQVVYAKTPPPPPLKWATGLIVDKALWNSTRTFKIQASASAVPMWFSVDNNTKITVDGVAVTYDKLAKGQTAEVGYAPPPPLMTPVVLPILASVVSAKSPPPPPVVHVIGRLAAVDLVKGTISVATMGSVIAPIVIKVTDATVIDKLGPKKLVDLTPAGPGYPGDAVDVTMKPVVATSLDLPTAISVVVVPETLMGVISGVDPIGRTFKMVVRTVVSPIVGVTNPTMGVLFTVVPDTKIVKNGIPVGLGDLRPQDAANVKYFQFGAEKRAAFVEAKSPLAITN